MLKYATFLVDSMHITTLSARHWLTAMTLSSMCGDGNATRPENPSSEGLPNAASIAKSVVRAASIATGAQASCTTKPLPAGPLGVGGTMVTVPERLSCTSHGPSRKIHQHLAHDASFPWHGSSDLMLKPSCLYCQRIVTSCNPCMTNVSTPTHTTYTYRPGSRYHLSNQAQKITCAAEAAL